MDCTFPHCLPVLLIITHQLVLPRWTDKDRQGQGQGMIIIIILVVRYSQTVTTDIFGADHYEQELKQTRQTNKTNNRTFLHFHSFFILFFIHS